MKNLNDLAQKIHENAKAKGFWDEARNTGEVFMLIVSELGEALDAHREGKRCGVTDFKKWLQKFGQDQHFKNNYEIDFKGSIEEEIADVVIRILDYCYVSRLEISHDLFSDIDSERGNNNIGDYLLSITGSIFYASVSAKSKALHIDLGMYPNIITSESDELIMEIHEAIAKLFGLAETLGFDLMRHIELKMQYNATLERLYGKKY